MGGTNYGDGKLNLYIRHNTRNSADEVIGMLSHLEDDEVHNIALWQLLKIVEDLARDIGKDEEFCNKIFNLEQDFINYYSKELNTCPFCGRSMGEDENPEICDKCLDRRQDFIDD